MARSYRPTPPTPMPRCYHAEAAAYPDLEPGPICEGCLFSVVLPFTTVVHRAEEALAANGLSGGGEGRMEGETDDRDGPRDSPALPRHCPLLRRRPPHHNSKCEAGMKDPHARHDQGLLVTVPNSRPR